MKKHKVLFVIESLGGGGAEKVLTTLLRHLDYSKFEVGLLSIADGGIHEAELPKDVNYYSALSRERQSHWWYRLKHRLIHRILPMWLVNWWIMPHGYDTHVAFVEGFATKLVAAGPSCIRKIAWVHIDITLFPWTVSTGIFKDKRAEATAYSMYDRVVTVSRQLRDNFAAAYGIDAVAVYNPLDVKEILKASEKAVDFPAKKALRIVSVGRLVEQKGYEGLIRCVALMRERGMDVELVILGEGDRRWMLERIVQETGLNGIVHLAGYRNNPYPIMKTADVFVCSSLQEGFSLAIAEAMVLGLPVVSTRCTGPSELLGEGEYGLLTDNSEDALMDGLMRMVSDALLRESYSRLSLRRAAVFGVDASVWQVESILKGDNL